MTENDEATPRTYRIHRKQLDIVEAYALANFDGNLSMALRRIIDEWATFKETPGQRSDEYKERGTK